MLLELTLAMALCLTGCGSKDIFTVSEPLGIQESTEMIGEEGAATGRIAFHVRYLYPSDKVAKSAVVARMTAYVYEPDDAKITQVDREKVGDYLKPDKDIPQPSEGRVKREGRFSTKRGVMR